jgi:hypothetical protein
LSFLRSQFCGSRKNAQWAFLNAKRSLVGETFYFFVKRIPTKVLSMSRVPLRDFFLSKFMPILLIWDVAVGRPKLCALLQQNVLCVGWELSHPSLDALH